jgi:hypothetical protein
MKWKALVLGSGGAIGEFQVGAIAHLATKYTQFDFYCGSGVGSMNSSIIAQYPSLQEGSDKLVAIWDTLKGTEDLFDEPFLGPGLGALNSLISKKKGGIYGNRNLKKVIEANVSWDRLKDKNNWVVEFTSLNDGQIYRATNYQELFNQDVNHKRRFGISFDPTDGHYMGTIFADLITAAGCVPFVIEPKTMGGDRFVEGGIRNVIPLDIAIKAFELAKNKGYTEAEFVIINNYTHDVMTVETTQVDGSLEILLRTLTNIIPIQMAQSNIAVGKDKLEALGVHPNSIKLLEPNKIFEGNPMDFSNLTLRHQIREHGLARAKEMIV